MNKRIITTQDASIKTVTVEVKTIQINNKQMTLSVFKQLIDEDILDYQTGELRGPAWGIVNYHPDNCKDAAAHFHVVWQKGVELRRASIAMLNEHAPDYNDKFNRPPDVIAALNRAALAYMLARTLEGYSEDDGRTVAIEIQGEQQNFDTIRRSHIDKFHSLNGYWLISRGDRTNPGDVSYLREQSENMRSLLAQWEYPQDSQRIYSEFLMPTWERYQHYQETWERSYHQLKDLPQLFIAV